MATTKRVNVDFNEEILKEIDEIAEKIGVPRQSLIKMWIYEKIKEENKDD